MGFAYNFLKSPRQIGAVCPSSHYLASTLVKAALSEAEGLIVDLGAGTGVVTGKLLEYGVPSHSIVAVERCSTFAAGFQRKYPGVLALEADACRLTSLLQQFRPDVPVRAVISSLPFCTLPPDIRREVSAQIATVLRQRGGLLIQYSYAWWMHFPLRRYGFAPRQRYFVFRNVPPAIVEVYSLP